MLLIRALELADIPFEQNSYPEENHGLGGVRKAVYHNFDRFWSKCFGHDLTWCPSTATVCWKVYSIANVTRIRNIYYWFCYNEIAIIYVSLERLLFKRSRLHLGQNSDRYHLYPLCISFCLGVFFNFSGLNFIREADSSGIPKPSGFSGRKNSLIRLDIISQKEYGQTPLW